MRISSVVAAGAFVVLVPLAFLLAFFGFLWGLYSYAAIPFVLVGIVLLLLILLLFSLPHLRAAER